MGRAPSGPCSQSREGAGSESWNEQQRGVGDLSVTCVESDTWCLQYTNDVRGNQDADGEHPREGGTEGGDPPGVEDGVQGSIAEPVPELGAGGLF